MLHGWALPAPREAVATDARSGRIELPLLAVVAGTVVLVALVAAVAPGLARLGVAVLKWLGTLGERGAQPGAIPFEQLLVPAVDGFVRICQKFVLSYGLFFSVVFVAIFGPWLARYQKTATALIDGQLSS